jgi:hypothetical protein
MRNISKRSCTGNQNTYHIQLFLPPKIFRIMRWCEKILWSQTGRRWQYGACALHVGYQRLQTTTQNM